MPSMSSPNTTCLPSSQSVLSTVMKNCDPLELGPEFAIDSWPMSTQQNNMRPVFISDQNQQIHLLILIEYSVETILQNTHKHNFSNWRLVSPGSVCLRTKFSSSNLRPYMDFPPVPLWLVKSPPWHINWGMIRWKLLPLNPKPFSCVHRQRKFSTGEQTNKTAVLSWDMSQWNKSRSIFSSVLWSTPKQNRFSKKGGASKAFGLLILTCSHGHNVRSQEEEQPACRFVADLDVHVDLWVIPAFFRWRFSLHRNTKCEI